MHEKIEIREDRKIQRKIYINLIHWILKNIEEKEGRLSRLHAVKPNDVIEEKCLNSRQIYLVWEQRINIEYPPDTTIIDYTTEIYANIKIYKMSLEKNQALWTFLTREGRS